jgi:hypothetical protein
MRSIESPFRKMNEDSNAMMNSQAQRDVKSIVISLVITL